MHVCIHTYSVWSFTRFDAGSNNSLLKEVLVLLFLEPEEAQTTAFEVPVTPPLTLAHKDSEGSG